jgi:hypothetical protein
MAATPEMFTVPSSLSILILEADRGKITQPAMISTMIQALEQQLDGGPLADLKSVVVDGPGFVKEVQSLVSTYDHVIGKQLPRFQGVDKVLVVEGQRIVADSVSLIQQHTVGLISSSAQANEAEIAIGALSDGPIYPFKSPLKAYVITTQCFEAGLDRLEQSLSATASPSLTAAEVSTTVIVEAEAYLADIHSGLEMTRPYAYSVIHMAVTAVEGTALSIARSSNSVAETQFTSILSRVTTDPRTTSLGGELLRILGIPSSVSSPVSSPVLSSQPPEGETSTLTVSGASKTPGTESNVTNTSGTASSSASPLAAPPVVAPISPLVAPPVVVTDAASYDPSTQTVQFQLAQPSLTSAGVFDAEGRLVRVLWTMSELSAGTHVASWDGFNDEGVAAPAGAYSINIILNRETSQNVAAIGNSETNPNVSFDTPDTFAGVTVDPTGAIYTANLWDEPGADFEKWDSQGNAVYNAEFYVRNSVPGGLPYSITSDSAYFYIAVSIQNGLQQIERYNLATGAEAPFLNAGGRIDVTEPSAPAGYVYPLTSLAVAGSSLWVVDALRGLLLQYDKSSGVLLGQFAVSSPQAVAIDASGNLWIGQHDNTISIYSPGGELLGSPLTHLQSIAGIAFGPDGRLYVADSVAGQVKIYRINGTTATLSQTLGNKATPGDTNPADFSTLAGVAVDPAGDIITIENQPVVGSRLARWSPSGQLLWEQFGNESQSIGTYSQANPSLFYTTSFHAYDLTDPSTGSWSYIDNTFSGGTPYASASDGVPRILSIAGSQFYFMPNGDGVQIYQIEDGIYHLASIIGGDSPAPDGSSGTEAAGQWTWDDATGTGIPTAAEMHWFTSPGQVQYPAETMNVDDAGNIWFANRLDGSIWEIPMGPLDDLGNPTYEWSSAVKVVQPDESALGFLPRVVQRATDGSIYALGSSTEWPSGPSELWMGGTTLVKYDSSGNLLWAVKAPEMCTGFDFVPGGGVMIGGGTSAIVYQYSSDGLLIGDLSPGSGLEYTSGWMDENGSLVVDRSPVDGELDVFTEDDYGLHIGWYRVNDQLVTNLTVPISSPSIPAAVTGLSTPSVSPSGVTLSWEPTPDVSGYIVERSPNGSNDWVTISDIESSILDPSTAMLSLTDTTPQPTDTVYYQVYARNSAGLSASSTTIAVTVPTTSVGTTVSNDMSQIAYFSFDASGPLTQPWTQSGGTWTQSGGVLYQTSSVPGNKKALLTDQSYPANTQITAKVRVDDWNDTNSGDTVGGVGVLTDPSTGSGYNLVFSSADSVSFLDDQVALGNSYSFD